MDPVDLYRLSRSLYIRRFYRLARLIKALNVFLFRAVLPPEMEAGSNLKLGHFGMGVVIHPNTTIGNDVFIYHNVTLATERALDQPERIFIEDEVTIGTGAVIIGPRRIGRGSLIGAGAIVTKDVPPGVVVAGNPARVIRAARPGERKK